MYTIIENAKEHFVNFITDTEGEVIYFESHEEAKSWLSIHADDSDSMFVIFDCDNLMLASV